MGHCVILTQITQQQEEQKPIDELGPALLAR